MSTTEAHTTLIKAPPASALREARPANLSKAPVLRIYHPQYRAPLAEKGGRKSSRVCSGTPERATSPIGGSGAALEGVNEACVLRAQGKLISRATPKVPQMTGLGLSLAGSALCLLAGSYLAVAPAPLPGGRWPQRHPRRLCVTSVGPSGGANLHGLSGGCPLHRSRPECLRSTALAAKNPMPDHACHAAPGFGSRLQFADEARDLCIGDHGGVIVQVFLAPAAENEPFRFNGCNDHLAG